MAEIYAQLSKKFCLKSAHEIGFLLGGIFHLLMKISFRQGDKLCQTLAEISSELALMKLTPGDGVKKLAKCFVKLPKVSLYKVAKEMLIYLWTSPGDLNHPMKSQPR